MYLDGEFYWLAELKAFGSDEEECKNIIREKTGFIITSCEEVKKTSTKGTPWQDYGEYKYTFVLPKYDYDNTKRIKYLRYSSNTLWLNQSDYDQYSDSFYREQERKKKEEELKENNKINGLIFLEQMKQKETCYREELKRYNLSDIVTKNDVF